MVQAYGGLSAKRQVKVKEWRSSMVMARRTRGHKLYQRVGTHCSTIVISRSSPIGLGHGGLKKRAGDIRIDVSIDIESITTMF